MMVSAPSPSISPEWVSAIFAGISTLAAGTSFWFSKTATQRAFRLEWTKEVVSWSRQAVSCLTSAQCLYMRKSLSEPDFKKERHRLVTSLSSLIDEGRFFFENKPMDNFGAEKPSAYRGIRPDLLTYLVWAHDLVLNNDEFDEAGNEDIVEYIGDAKRQFVSALQEIIEPNWFSRQASYKEQKATL